MLKNSFIKTTLLATSLLAFAPDVRRRPAHPA